MQPILELFLEQLSLLKDPRDSSYTDAFGLLERLTEIRGFMLVFDCPEPESIIVSLVTTCLSVARGVLPVKGAAVSETYNQLENLMAPLLTNILGEACWDIHDLFSARLLHFVCIVSEVHIKHW